MSIFKKLSIVFIAAILALSFTFHSFAKEIDFAEWNSLEKVFVIADKHIPSNSGLINAQLKLRYEDPYRMRMLFMLKYNSFSEDGNPGVRFRLNNGDEISFNLNGESEYNEDKYYLDFICEANHISGFVWFEVTFGVKEGIPEEKVLTVVFSDPVGIPSNTYTVDLKESDQITETAYEEKTQSKTNKHNSQTNTKTDKTKKTNSQNTTTSQTENSEVIIHNADNGNVQRSAVNEKVLFISAAAIVLASLIFTGGMHFLKRKKHKGDES